MTDADFQTGRKFTVRAWHNTQTGTVKYGRGGAFFAPDPTPEYGNEAIEVYLTIKRPLVVGDKVDAATAVAPEVAADVERLIVDDAPTSSNPQRIFAQVDVLLAQAARRAGYDGIVYLNPMSLSRHEYVALRPRMWRALKVRAR